MHILVTGGTGGLGTAIIKKLAADKGNTLHFTYASSSDRAGQLQAEIENCQGIHCDFTIPSSVDDLVAALENMAPDVLINNAWRPFTKTYLHKKDDKELLSGFEQDILPAIRITNAAINIFRKKKSGKIINILSSAIIGKPPIGWSEYVANKNYMLSLSKSWAVENIKFNITTNCISPSFMETKFTGDTDQRVIEQMTADHPLKKLLTPEEVADAAFFLVNCSPHINGINLVINAGMDL